MAVIETARTMQQLAFKFATRTILTLQSFYRLLGECLFAAHVRSDMGSRMTVDGTAAGTYNRISPAFEADP